MVRGRGDAFLSLSEPLSSLNPIQDGARLIKLAASPAKIRLHCRLAESREEVSKQILWNNQFVRINDKPLFNRRLFKRYRFHFRHSDQQWEVKTMALFCGYWTSACRFFLTSGYFLLSSTSVEKPNQLEWDSYRISWPA